MALLYRHLHSNFRLLQTPHVASYQQTPSTVEIVTLIWESPNLRAYEWTGDVFIYQSSSPNIVYPIALTSELPWRLGVSHRSTPDTSLSILIELQLSSLFRLSMSHRVSATSFPEDLSYYLSSFNLVGSQNTYCGSADSTVQQHTECCVGKGSGCRLTMKQSPELMKFSEKEQCSNTQCQRQILSQSSLIETDRSRWNG